MQLRTRETVQFSSRNENVCVLRTLATKSVTTRDFLRYFENGCNDRQCCAAKAWGIYFQEETKEMHMHK